MRRASTAVVVLALVAGACGDESDPRLDGAASTELEVPDDVRAYAMPRSELEASYHRLAEQALRHEASAQGVRLARDAARLARVLARRTGETDHIAAARRHLREASRRKALAGACDAALELARLESVDAQDLRAAYTVAYRAARRFVRTQPSCVAEARRMMAVLEAFRPRAAELAAIDADPDAEDPSAGLEPAQGERPGEQPEPERSAGDDVEAWAARRGAEGAGTRTLERIVVHGGSGEQSRSVRVVLYFDHVAVFRRGELPADGALPRRAYLDLENVVMGSDVRRAIPVGAGGLVRVRTAPLEAGVTRVAFDLAPDAVHGLFVLTDPYRLVLDFERGRQAAPGERRVRLVVIDPGHGGSDTGARIPDGASEAELALDISRRVRTLLGRRLDGVRVVLTRERDDFVSVEARPALANSLQADLFVSIHLNAHPGVERGGAATFVLDTTDDRQTLRLAAIENGTSEREVTDLQAILAALHRADQARASRRLADLIQRGVMGGARRVLPNLPDRGVKAALFYVLVGTRMPAVLVEASFITQDDEARALGTDHYRQALAEGIAEGIARYAGGG